jgi:hypothetical protein
MECLRLTCTRGRLPLAPPPWGNVENLRMNPMHRERLLR